MYIAIHVILSIFVSKLVAKHLNINENSPGSLNIHSTWLLCLVSIWFWFGSFQEPLDDLICVFIIIIIITIIFII